LSRPFPPRQFSPGNFTRVNNKIRAREVRVIGENQQQLGVMSLPDALNLARSRGVDLVEIAPNATPPVCRLVDYGKFRYEQSKKEKESKKHQHANRVKEIQLSANIDPHDFSVKLSHAIDFLCEDMKVKVTLRFRGREMAHQEFGFSQVKRFIKELEPYAHPDAPPKLIGKGINVMLTPLPRNKRAKNPNQDRQASEGEQEPKAEEVQPSQAKSKEGRDTRERIPTNGAENSTFGQNPFAQLNVNGQ
jgi:translation initiation factor IF-3